MKKIMLLLAGSAWMAGLSLLSGCQSTEKKEEKTSVAAVEKIEARQTQVASAIDSAPALPVAVAKPAALTAPETNPSTSKLTTEPVKKKAPVLAKKPVKLKLNKPVTPKPEVPAKRLNLKEEVNFSQGLPQELRKQVTTAHGLSVDKEKTWKGQPLVRIELRPEDVAAGVVRSEILLKADTEPEAKYGWVMFFPKEYWGPTDEFDIVMQLHGYDDKILGEKARNPQFALFVHKDHLKVTIHHSDLPVNTNANDVDEKFDLGPLPKDQYLALVLEIRHSYESDGYARLFINGKKVLDYQGGTSFNDMRKYPYFKAGIYNRHVQLPRVVYISDIRHGDAKSSYKDVAP